MEETLIAFRLPKDIPNRVYTRFLKKFYGQETSSHGGKYQYHRRGLLNDLPYVKLIRGVIIVRSQDLDKILTLFKEFNVECHIRSVKLLESDIQILWKGKE